MATRADLVRVFAKTHAVAGAHPDQFVRRFYWHKVASNGRKLSGGLEPFATLQSAVRAAQRANLGCSYDLQKPVFKSRGRISYWETISVRVI